MSIVVDMDEVVLAATKELALLLIVVPVKPPNQSRIPQPVSSSLITKI